jgi:hypothetical protein
MDVKSIIKQAIITLEEQEKELEHKLCQHILVA